MPRIPRHLPTVEQQKDLEREREKAGSQVAWKGISYFIPTAVLLGQNLKCKAEGRGCAVKVQPQRSTVTTAAPVPGHLPGAHTRAQNLTPVI